MARITVKRGENLAAAMERSKRERINEIVSDAAINAAKMVEDARLDERGRCAKLVPTTWLDPLLSGKGAPQLPLSAHALEALLRAIQNRIRNREE